MQKRMNLMLFRVRKKLSQQEFADAIGVPRQTYAMVERGQRRGSDAMWAAIKEKFDVTDADMWQLMQKEG